MSAENFNKLHFNLLDRVKSLEENPGSLPGGGEDNSILIKNVKIKTGNLPIIGDSLTKIYVNRKTIVNDSSLFQLISQLEDVDCPYFKVGVLEDEFHYIGLYKSLVAENIYQFIVCEGWGKCDQGFLINPTDQDIEYPYAQITMPAHSLFRIRYDEEEGYGPIVEQVFEDFPELKIASDNEAVISEVSENWGTLASKHLSINEPFEIEEGVDWKKLEKSISDFDKGKEGVLTKKISDSTRNFKDSYNIAELANFVGKTIYHGYFDPETGDTWNLDEIYINYFEDSGFELWIEIYDQETFDYLGEKCYFSNNPIYEDGWYDCKVESLLERSPELVVPESFEDYNFGNISDPSELDLLLEITESGKKLKNNYSTEELDNFLGDFDQKGIFQYLMVSRWIDDWNEKHYWIEYNVPITGKYYDYCLNSSDVPEDGWYEYYIYTKCDTPSSKYLNFLKNPVGELYFEDSNISEYRPASGHEFDELFDVTEKISLTWSKITPGSGGDIPEYSNKDIGNYLGVTGPSKFLTFKDNIDESDLMNLLGDNEELEIQFYRGSGHMANMIILPQEGILGLSWEGIDSPENRYLYLPKDTELEGMYFEKGWYDGYQRKLSEGPMTDIDTTDEGIDVSGKYFSISISEFINIPKFKRLFKTESYLKWVDLKKWDDEIAVILPFKYYDTETDSWKIMYISASYDWVRIPVTWETFINHCDHPEIFSYSDDDEILFNNNRLTGKDIGHQYKDSPINYDIMYIEEQGE